ncbi:MAG: hypothetical protein ACI9BD_000081 [Candidatus Marinamargulisbacteria bacterium]|jgi:hypothetical protein
MISLIILSGVLSFCFGFILMINPGLMESVETSHGEANNTIDNFVFAHPIISGIVILVTALLLLTEGVFGYYILIGLFKYYLMALGAYLLVMAILLMIKPELVKKINAKGNKVVVKVDELVFKKRFAIGGVFFGAAGVIFFLLV